MWLHALCFTAHVCLPLYMSIPWTGIQVPPTATATDTPRKLFLPQRELGWTLQDRLTAAQKAQRSRSRSPSQTALCMRALSDTVKATGGLRADHCHCSHTCPQEDPVLLKHVKVFLATGGRPTLAEHRAGHVTRSRVTRKKGLGP